MGAGYFIPVITVHVVQKLGTSSKKWSDPFQCVLALEEEGGQSLLFHFDDLGMEIRVGGASCAYARLRSRAARSRQPVFFFPRSIG